MKIPKPDKPEPENETRGYPMYFYRQKTGKIKLLCTITYQEFFHKWFKMTVFETINPSKLISRKISAFLVPAFMKAKAKAAKTLQISHDFEL